MQTAAFTLSTDGSNDNRSKQFPIVIRSMDQNTGLFQSELLSLPVCTGSVTGENIFKILDGEINARNLEWSNCLALGCDNAPVLTGNKIGVISYIRNKHDSLFLAGCCLHVVHNVAQKEAKCLPDVAEFLQDVYYYFQKSDKPYAHKKVENILKFLKLPTNKLYVLFLGYTVKMYDDVLVVLQSDEPKIHVLRKMLVNQIVKVLCRFVKPAAMSSCVPEAVDFNSRYNLKDNNDLVIGNAARSFIADSDNNGLRDMWIKQFYGDVKLYFKSVCSYLIEKLPFKEPILRHAVVADASLQRTAKLSDMTFFLHRFPALRPPGCTIDTVVEQFAIYQYTDLSTCTRQRMDETWAAVGNKKDEEGALFLSELSVIMQGILTIPHSNANCERIFSTVLKNRTEQRSSVGDDTLETLLFINQNLFIHLNPNASTQLNIYRS